MIFAFANAVAVAMYVVGFAETVVDLLKVIKSFCSLHPSKIIQFNLLFQGTRGYHYGKMRGNRFIVQNVEAEYSWHQNFFESDYYTKPHSNGPECLMGKIITQLLVIGRHPIKKKKRLLTCFAFLISIPVKSKVDCD